MEDIKSTLQKLKPFIGKKADALWVRYNTGDRIEKQEWEQVINLLAEKYKSLAEKEKDVIFGGRLGSYEYFDMDQTIKGSLACIYNELDRRR